MLIRAAEQDQDQDDQGHEDVELEGQVNDDGGDEDDAGAADVEEPDASGDTDGGEVVQLDQKRRAIEERAEARREEARRLAAETAAAAARETTRETEAARRRAEEERTEREAMAAMTEEQRATYLVAKDQRALRNDMAQNRLTAQSIGDQSRFDRVLDKKPQYAKHADEVERRHQQGLQNGQFVPRAEILKHLLGDLLLKDERAANVRRQKDAGRARVNEARGNGRAARGDTTGGARGGKSVVQRAEEQDWAI